MSDLNDRPTMILTGFTAGIGTATAMELAHRGVELGLVCRDLEKGERVRVEIQAATGNDRLRVFQCDLSLMSEVRRLSAELLDAYPKIDVLLNNAGMFATRRQLTREGLELTFATNHMAYFVLSLSLLDRLKAAPAGRIVNVASTAHKNVRRGLDFDDLQNEKSYSGFNVYCQSKLANIHFTFELARRLREEGATLTANCLHPGVIGSELIRPWGSVVSFFWKLFTATPEEGAKTSVYLATSPEVQGVSGKYFDESKEARVSHAARDTDAAKRLWDASAKIAGL